MRVPTLATRPPSRRPGISAEVMRDLHAADRTLGLRRPVAPLPPRPSQHALAMASSASLHAVVTAYEDTADDVEILLATLAELAPFADAVKTGCSR